MKSCYINGIGSVSIQEPSFDVFQSNPEPITYINHAKQPSYKELIAPAMSRRMAKGIKMSIYATDVAMKEAQINILDAIVVGTSLGCIEDSEKFLQAVIENEEEYLTPTAFIQSTHNTVAGQIALQYQCKAYNFTFVNGGSSFESALFDACLQMRFNNVSNLLLGGVDEIAPYSYSMFEFVDRVKKENDDINFMLPTSVGVPYGEGATFFVLSTEKSTTSYAEVIDVCIQNQLASTPAEFIESFLKRNGIDKPSAVVLGVNADKNQQEFYIECGTYLKDVPQLYYQHLSGSYDTASAFGLKIAAEIIKKQEIPNMVQYNEINVATIQSILVINQSLGTDFSLTLLTSC